MSREVAIIGCGPAGLLAAHAAALADFCPVIYSKEVKPSPHARATYLHRAIPDVTSRTPDAYIHFGKVGREEVYAEKVYGDPLAPTSWARFSEGHQPAWALAPVYARLWHLYRGAIREAEIGPEEAEALTWSYRHVINTAPAPALCALGCNFPARRIWVEDFAPAAVRPNSMVYNGSPHYSWYRSSDVFGVRSTEYAEQPDLDPDFHAIKEGIKVQPTNCPCNHLITRAGRWGTWRPGVLVHHAFEVAAAELNLAELRRAA